ncbi:hypothetical protein [Marinisporobacter balticus]|uniref:Uncharacterized protein n=1 Tax=Marinisporobacter balticus TaxID=2018667 RepID=A0A4R2KQE8_9FIRM|nr:hypothetical protein [Marinisporobacter balticus]TCO76491.1 hypothetical protein EV214_10894 [Marinisporobacter balticus]
MEDNKREELNLQKADAEVLDLKVLEEIKDKNIEKPNTTLANMITSLFSNDKILPILLFTLLAKEEKKEVKSYLGDQLKGVLGKAENMLDIMYALDGYAKNRSVSANTYNETEHQEAKSVIEVLEVIRPHVHGKGGKKIDQALMVNDRIHRLKENAKNKKNIINEFENLTDILEILEFNEGYEIREVLNKAKDIIEIMKR